MKPQVHWYENLSAIIASWLLRRIYYWILIRGYRVSYYVEYQRKAINQGLDYINKGCYKILSI